MSQEDINALLVRKAQESKVVVRLKGGDPYVFGRGGEEAMTLRAAGVRYEVVPGVTAGIAAPAYAGIPVTHRDCNTVLSFVTGHEDPLKGESTIDWESLARGGGTLAFYMGIGNLPAIVDNLVRGGRSADTPVAVIRCGTLPTQQVVEGTLSTIVGRVRDAGLKPPAITLVGEVVRLRRDLQWFETLPLFGKTVVVTRSRTHASDFAQQLRERGARVLLFPTIAIAPVVDPEPLRQALGKLATFDWVVFTSVNSVDSVFAALDDAGGDARRLGRCKVMAIGSATAARLRHQGVRADLVPPRFTSEAVFAALLGTGELREVRFLLPRADIAPPFLPDALRAAGAVVTEVTAYRTVPGEPEAEVFEALRAGEVDVVTFTSSSTARNYAAIVRQALGELPRHVTYVSIGPETTREAMHEGLAVAVEASEHTIPGLVSALARYFEGGIA
jgi:uroporphyrinogen III methyltransferase/synthase